MPWILQKLAKKTKNKPAHVCAVCGRSISPDTDGGACTRCDQYIHSGCAVHTAPRTAAPAPLAQSWNLNTASELLAYRQYMRALLDYQSNKKSVVCDACYYGD